MAERAIGVLQNIARTILLHAMANWPSQISKAYWPFAIRHAAKLHNVSLHNIRSASPWELFTGETPPWSLSDFPVFGSPVYVLHKALQDGTNRAKWKFRCWKGVYVAHSLQHSGSVALIYNPQTCHVSPQFYELYDEHFSSVANHNLTDQALDALYNTDKWIKPSTQADCELPPEYYSDSFWSNPPEETRLPNIGDKRKRPSQSSPEPSIQRPNPSQDQSLVPPEQHSIAQPIDNHDSNNPSTKIQFRYLPESEAFQEWKRQKCINASIPYCARIIPPSPVESPAHQPDLPSVINVFQAALDHGNSDFPSLFSS